MSEMISQHLKDTLGCVLGVLLPAEERGFQIFFFFFFLRSLLMMQLILVVVQMKSSFEVD